MDSDADSNFDYARWEKVVVNPDGSYVVYNDADYYYEFYSLNHELLRKVKKEYVKGLCRAMSMLNLHHTGFSSNSRAMNGCRCQTSALQNSKLHKIFSLRRKFNVFKVLIPLKLNGIAAMYKMWKYQKNIKFQAWFC